MSELPWRAECNSQGLTTALGSGLLVSSMLAVMLGIQVYLRTVGLTEVRVDGVSLPFFIIVFLCWLGFLQRQPSWDSLSCC